MYIRITKQHMGATFSQSSGDYVNYLEKENEERSPELQEHFFDQNNDHVSPQLVVQEIDGNTAKLKKRDPKFYALTINPSQGELKHINNDPQKLKTYVREIMKDYAKAFHRDTSVTVDQIKYFAKVEYERRYKGFDKALKENQPYISEITKLKHDLVKIRNNELNGNPQKIQRQIQKLEQEAPHQINGKMIVQGMKKEGSQLHVHIIVSRKDVSNSYSLSPGSSYKASEAKLNGKLVKRGFHRDQFYENAEKTFDRLFKYKRNFVESYTARKLYTNNTHKYFAHLLGLPTSQRSAALKLMGRTGVPMMHIPTNKVQLALQAIKKVKRAIQITKSASSIGI